MHLVDIAWLYLTAGVACGVAVHRKSLREGSRPWGSALLAVVLWPLWAPVALTKERPTARPAGCAVSELEQALQEGADAVRGTALQALLPPKAVQRLLAEVAQAAARAAELDGVLSQRQFDETTAQHSVERLERDGNRRALASARLHLANVRRLAELRDRDRRALEELKELVMALRTQLVLARFAGSSTEGAGELVGEMWARVESLGEVLDSGTSLSQGSTERRESELS